jgi:hypothetical protein
MREPSHRSRFADQATARMLGIAVRDGVGVHQLHRDVARELGIVRLVDHAHAARADASEHAIASDLHAPRRPREQPSFDRSLRATSLDVVHRRRHLPQRIVLGRRELSLGRHEQSLQAGARACRGAWGALVALPGLFHE